MNTRSSAAATTRSHRRSTRSKYQKASTSPTENAPNGTEGMKSNRPSSAYWLHTRRILLIGAALSVPVAAMIPMDPESYSESVAVLKALGQKPGLMFHAGRAVGCMALTMPLAWAGYVVYLLLRQRKV